MEQHYDYMIVGSGLAGVSAIDGVRKQDKAGTLLLIGEEHHMPYDRPPLSKKLWWGKKTVEEIVLKSADFYVQNGVDLKLGSRVVELDVTSKTAKDDQGNRYSFNKLLLATGGKPHRLPIPGGDLPGISYYRSLDDYLAIRAVAAQGRSALIIGGGFIGSEIAASLRSNGLEVTMLFPGPYLVHKVFPDYLGRALTEQFRARGIRIEFDLPAAIEGEGKHFIVVTGNGIRHEADMVIVGIGIAPEIGLAQQAGLTVDNGIVVDDYLATSHPDIFAAGDNTFFRSALRGRRTRLEHWDNALHQGRYAGRNMAGAREPYDYEPYFFSDLFEFGYEAVGEVDARLATFADWQKENHTGVIYYLRDDMVRGVMLCNVWNKVAEARALLHSGERATPDSLRGRIR